MGKLIVTVISTLDGYAAGEGGNIFAMPIDLGFDRYNLDRMRAAGRVLLGATTYHQGRQYWPPLADEESAPEVEREISRLYNTLPKIVISDRTGPQDTDPWGPTTEIVRRDEAPARLTELKASDQGDIVCFGSLTTWHDLLAQGLVDEVHVLVGPGTIGAGQPTFGPTARQFTLLDAQRLDDSALVALRYAVAPAISNAS